MIKIQLAKNALSGPLGVLAKVINSKSIYPILDNFLFEIKDGKVRVTSSDNETSMVTNLQVVECEGEGAICIPAKSFLEGLSNIPEQPLTIGIDDLNVLVSYQNGEFKMVGQRADEFPQAAAIEGKEISLSGKDLASGIGNVVFATANDELRPVLCGVYFDMLGDHIIFVATDGQRLITSQKKAETNDMPSFILPKKPSGLVKAFAENESDVKIQTDGKNAKFIGGGFELICRLVDGKYPNWQNVVRKDSKFSMEIERNSLLAALKRVSVFTSTSGMVRFDISENSVKVLGENIEFAVSAKEELPCKFNSEMSIGFKASHMIEILSNLSDETINIGLEEPSKAGLIVSKEDVGVILMPMVLS